MAKSSTSLRSASGGHPARTSCAVSEVAVICRPASPSVIFATPSSQPLMTIPRPSLKRNGLPLSTLESNLVPSFGGLCSACAPVAYLRAIPPSPALITSFVTPILASAPCELHTEMRVCVCLGWGTRFLSRVSGPCRLPHRRAGAASAAGEARQHAPCCSRRAEAAA